MNRPHLIKLLSILAGVIAILLLLVAASILIIVSNANESPCGLYKSIMTNSTSHAERLISQGMADEPCRGIYPIHAASMQANKSLLNLILREGVDPNRPDDERGETPLMWVVSKSGLSRTKDVECFDLLIASGATINAKAKKSENSILHKVIFYRNPKTIEDLIKYGADINAQNKKGKTPLHTAVEQGNLNHVEVLVKNGANTSVVDHNNETPLDIAKRMNLPEIEKLLSH